MIKNKIQELAAHIFNDVVGYRQHIHANPELSFKEFETSKFVKEKLAGWGIEFTDCANTGVVGLIKGNLPSDKVIALRADMDAARKSKTKLYCWSTCNAFNRIGKGGFPFRNLHGFYR